MSRQFLRRLWFASMILSLLAGCTTIKTSETTILPYTPQPLPALEGTPGQYSGLAWLDQGLVVQANVAGAPSGFRLFWVQQSMDLSDLIPIPDAPDADLTFHHRPDRLPDGRLGLIYETDMKVIGAPTDQQGYVAFDPTNNSLTELIPRPAPREILGHGRVSWNPSLDRALVTDGQELGSRFYWWTATAGFEPLDLDVAVAQYFAWSPDGTTIAFFGKPQIGSAGPTSALSSPANLYLMDANADNRRIILETAYNIAGLQWSPDGHWLVLVARLDGGRTVVWLLNPTTGERLPLTPPGRYQWPAWSPDGSQIAVIAYDPKNTGQRGNDYIITLAVPPKAR
ncbi:TolB family protein [Herpetosiphon geysericola]|uniref:Dipeptidylpeptidase IV N-terminal domain-containing protein n=1 Tax=Herpetosiphon geysericola TaxID=70996 RepID=A0A0N8GT37_9CHLR|nr:PD40 domain-containing protein [Herpetosiphon geysericola]KPL91010.1 hypothetical protein SE18_04440 [Herpetosiphon geysericola]